MSASRMPRTSRQLELFAPRPSIPHWNSLPEAVRRQATPLLARLLRSRRFHLVRRIDGWEVADE